MGETADGAENEPIATATRVAPESAGADDGEEYPLTLTATRVS